MNDRIKKIRKALGLTQKDFGERIGLRQNSVALIEGGRATSDQTVFAICREFNVNEEWLRTGVGEMFNPAPSAALDALAAEYGLSRADYILIEKFVNMKSDARKAVVDYVIEAAAALRSEEASEGESASSAADLADLDFDAKVELYRQELEREKEVEEKSKALRENA